MAGRDKAACSADQPNDMDEGHLLIVTCLLPDEPSKKHSTHCDPVHSNAQKTQKRGPNVFPYFPKCPDTYTSASY